MIKPTVGRVVLFHPPSNSSSAGFCAPEAGEPCAAIIAKVWGDNCVNLAVFDANGNPHSFTSVPLLQDNMPSPNWPHCEWMPYQKGQAAKTEEAESKLSDLTSG